ncbi:MAG: hypothetical protein HGB26_03635 [Desulfobulbaceae bacterium]|nr:hypothetical protein [Desulfobulbaceae bacterium]
MNSLGSQLMTTNLKITSFERPSAPKHPKQKKPQDPESSVGNQLPIQGKYIYQVPIPGDTREKQKTARQTPEDIEKKAKMPFANARDASQIDPIIDLPYSVSNGGQHPEVTRMASWPGQTKRQHD